MVLAQSNIWEPVMLDFNFLLFSDLSVTDFIELTVEETAVAELTETLQQKVACPL